MKRINQVLCNVLALASLMTLPAMAADGNSASISVAKSAPQVCTKGGACSVRDKKSISMRGGGFGKRLKLSDDQLEKIATLKSNFKTSVAPEFAQLKSLKFQLKDQMMQPTVDKDKVMTLESNINSVRSDLSTKRLTLKLDEMSVLTPEQKQELRHKMLVREAFGGFRGSKAHRFTARTRGFEGGRKA